MLPPGCRRLTEAEEGHCAADLQQEGKKQKEQSWSNGDRLGKMYGGAGKKRMKKTKEGVEKKKSVCSNLGSRVRRWEVAMEEPRGQSDI